MPNPQNENVIRRAFEYMSQPNRDPGNLDQFIDSSWEVRGGLFTPSAKGPEGAKQLHDMFWSAFSDFKLTPEHWVSDGEWVSVHYTMEGRHTGEFMGTPPTGKSFRIHSMGMWRIQNGKQGEGWVIPDRVDLFQQLGIMQMPGQMRRAA